jgi:hypothetical protein
MKTRYHAFSPTSSDSVNPTPLLSKAELEIRYNLAFWKFIVETLQRENISTYHDAHHHAAIVVDFKTSRGCRYLVGIHA